MFAKSAKGEPTPPALLKASVVTPNFSRADIRRSRALALPFCVGPVRTYGPLVLSLRRRTQQVVWSLKLGMHEEAYSKSCELARYMRYCRTHHDAMICLPCFNSTRCVFESLASQRNCRAKPTSRGSGPFAAMAVRFRVAYDVGGFRPNAILPAPSRHRKKPLLILPHPLFHLR